jgi:ribosomal protein L10
MEETRQKGKAEVKVARKRLVNVAVKSAKFRRPCILVSDLKWITRLVVEELDACEAGS